MSHKANFTLQVKYFLHSCHPTGKYVKNILKRFSSIDANQNSSTQNNDKFEAQFNELPWALPMGVCYLPMVIKLIVDYLVLFSLPGIFINREVKIGDC